MIQLAPIVLSSIALMASGKANPLYAPNPTIHAECSVPGVYGEAEGVAIPLKAGANDYKISLRGSVCRRLNSFARAPILRADDMAMAWALRVAAHEASHVFFFRSPEGRNHTERAAECRAVMNVARFARKLGASRKTAQRVYRLNTEIGLDEDYASPCANGHPFKVKPPAPR